MSRPLILVDFCWTRDKDPRVPLGHASLLASLRAVPGLDVRTVVVAVNAGLQRPEEVAAVILDHATGCDSTNVDVAFGAYVWGEDLLRAVLSALRRRGFRGRIILGGPQISYAGPGLEELYPEADAFVRGYGEDALVSITRAPGRPLVAGVHYAGQDDRCQRTTVDLETLPSPWLTGVVPIEGQRFIRWETQRGCPFRCSFCQHREPGARLRHRQLARSRVLDEVAFFCRHDVREIAVLDAIFNVGSGATDTLRAFVDGGFRGRLSLQCRAELVTPAFLDAAQMLDTCLEFGLQTIHAAEGSAIDRANDIEKVDRSLAEVRRRSIPHEVSLIFGLPEQTLDSFLASVRWCLERRVPVIKAFPLMLLRGTPLERTRHRWGLREHGASMPIVVASNSFDERAWAHMARVAEALAATEGTHPVDLDGLLRLAESCVPDLGRWQSGPLRRAA
ncbi:MAG: radical SAM protein [Archangium sp.]|nr:radical SAM protein [Archangium sp.]